MPIGLLLWDPVFIDEQQQYGQYFMSRQSLVSTFTYYIMAIVMASNGVHGL